MYHGLCYHRKFHCFQRFCKLQNNSELYSVVGFVNNKEYGYTEITYKELVDDYICFDWGKCKLGEYKYYYYVVSGTVFISPMIHGSRITNEVADSCNWIKMTYEAFRSKYILIEELNECIPKGSNEIWEYFFDYYKCEYVVRNASKDKVFRHYPDEFESAYVTDPMEIVTHRCTEELAHEINKSILKEVMKVREGNIIEIKENKLR